LPNQPPEVAALKEKMWQKSYYVMTRSMRDPSKIKPVLLDHYQWMIQMEKDDLVFASGPLFAQDGSQGVGMTVWRVESFEEADRLAAQDPFVSNGGVDYEIQRWQINEGRVNVSVDFSDQSFRVS
jgi:uncharacterized protein YciI